MPETRTILFPGHPVRTGFEDNITCPRCDAVDSETVDYPDFGEARDGATARWTCEECGSECVVTLCVSYSYEAVTAAPLTTEDSR